MSKKVNNNPQYLQLQSSGELKQRVKKVYDTLKDCTLYPHHCHVNRKKDEKV